MRDPKIYINTETIIISPAGKIKRRPEYEQNKP